MKVGRIDLLKNDGRERSSKNSKKNNIEKRKLKRTKCLNCRNMIEYNSEDIIRLKSGTQFIICTMCDFEIEL